MAILKSKAYVGGVPFRPVSEQPFEVASTILIPAGSALALNDTLKFMKIGTDVRVLSVTLITDDLDTGSSIVLDVGYTLPVGSDVVDFFLDGSTIGQAGGVAQVSNGGTPAFADGAFNGLAEIADLQVLVAVAPAGNPNTDRFVTLVVKAVAETTALTEEPYIYQFRYDNTGVSNV